MTANKPFGRLILAWAIHWLAKSPPAILIPTMFSHALHARKALGTPLLVCSATPTEIAEDA